MTDKASLLVLRDRPRPQTACDRCSTGVMDAANPHVWGECRCDCHGVCDVCDGPLDDAYRTDPDVGFRVCSRCDEAAQGQGGGSCTEDPDYVCTGWCSECEVNS